MRRSAEQEVAGAVDLADAAPTRPQSKLGYLPGLDGLRAVSVLIVLAFHFRPDHSLLSGGFLGVEVFFVISGYLITALLLDERRKKGKISFQAFWMRRIRRLFAALYATLVTVGLIVAVFYNEELGQLRGALFSGATYSTNWWQILSGVRYGDEGLRSPLGHLWSLAVEEQFYLLWPMLFALGLFVLGRRFKWAILGGVFASWVWMASIVATRPSFDRAVLLQEQKDAIADAFNRAYLGTDTRAAGLLLGAFLAFFWVPRKLRGRTGPNAARVLDGAAILAAIILLVLVFTAELQSVWLYWWGFALVDICTVVLIAATVHPVSHVGRLLGVKPLQYIGVRSYGIYLWGVAIFEFTRPGVGFDLDWSGPAVFVLRFVLVAVVTEASYRFIEQPVRGGALGRMWTQLRTAEGPRRERLVLRWQVMGATLVIVTGSLTIAAFAADPPKAATAAPCTGDDVLLDPVRCGTPSTFVPRTTTTTKKPTGPTTATKPGSTARTNPPNVQSGGYAFTGVGDSVMLGAANTLTQRLTTAVGPTNINADVGRQGSVCVDVVRAIHDTQKILAPVLIVHCGDNGYLNSNFVDQIMAIAGPKRHVVFLTSKVPRAWEGPNNQLIFDNAKKYPNAKVLDWHFHAVTKPASYFAKDTYHLSGPGVPFYVDLIYNFLDDQHWL